MVLAQVGIVAAFLVKGKIQCILCSAHIYTLNYSMDL